MSKFIKFPFKKEVVCFTGKSPYTRVKMHQMAIKAGAKISSSVTSKTTLLVVGKRSGSKLDRAFDKGIPIIADEEFIKQIK